MTEDDRLAAWRNAAPGGLVLLTMGVSEWNEGTPASRPCDDCGGVAHYQSWDGSEREPDGSDRAADEVLCGVCLMKRRASEIGCDVAVGQAQRQAANPSRLSTR